MTAPTERLPISYIVPAYNCASVIGDAVGSILAGNFEDGDEIVLVDDCSTDNTRQVLDELRARNPAVQVLGHKENRGTAAAARNTGIEAAINDLIFCLDADNLLAPNSIAYLQRQLRAEAADAAAFGEVHYFQTTQAEVTHKWIYRSPVSLADALAGPMWPGPSGNYMFTRDSWIRAGRYAEPYLENRSVDSWSFGIRQLGTGSKMITLAGTWYYHRYGYDSHYVRNWRRGNQSIAALMGLMPLIDQLDAEDVDYLFSPGGRYKWYEVLAERPIRVRGQLPGKNGQLQRMDLASSQLAAPQWRRILEKLGKRLGLIR